MAYTLCLFQVEYVVEPEHRCLAVNAGLSLCSFNIYPVKELPEDYHSPAGRLKCGIKLLNNYDEVQVTMPPQ